MTSFSVYYSVPIAGISGVTFEYGMWEGIRKLYEERIFAVALVIFLFSGIWPHVKLALLYLSSWIPAVSYKRLTYFRWLSELGKWSLVDVWVVTLIVVIVRLKTGMLKGPFADVWFQGVGESGIFVFLAAIIFSQILSILFIRLSRKDAESEISLTVNNLAAYNPLLNPADGDFEFDFNAMVPTEEKLSLWIIVRNSRRFFCYLLSLVLIVSSIMVIGAAIIPCYRVTYIDATTKKVIDEFNSSLFMTFVVAGQKNHVGDSSVALAILGMVCVVIIPIAQTCLLLFSWFQPLTVKSHRIISLIQEHFGHWSSMDSFFLALGVIIFEIGDLLKTSQLNSLVHIEVEPLPMYYILFTMSMLFGGLRWYVLHMQMSIIVATVESTALKGTNFLTPGSRINFGDM